MESQSVYKAQSKNWKVQILSKFWMPV